MLASGLHATSLREFLHIRQTTLKKIGEKAQAIIDILVEYPFIKREELAVRLGLTLEGVKYHLGQLQKTGYVLRDDGRKNGRWKVLIKK